MPQGVTVTLTEKQAKTVGRRARRKANPASTGQVVILKKVGTPGETKKPRRTKRVPQHLAVAHPSVIMHLNPFSRRAEGARIIDGFRAHSVAYPVVSSDMLSTDSTGGAQMLVMPSLACSLLYLKGAPSTTTNLFRFADGGAASGTNPAVGQGVVTVGGLALDTQMNLRTLGTAYRLVGWGVIIRALPGISTAGRVVLTKFTARGKAPVQTADALNRLTYAVADLGGANDVTVTYKDPLQTPLMADPATDQFSVAAFLRQNGLPAAGNAETVMNVEALRRIPGTVTATMASLGVNGLLTRGKRTSTQHSDWRGTGPLSAAAGDVFTGAMGTTTSASAPAWATMGTYARGWDTTYLDMTGHDGLAIAVTGAPASAAVLDFEMIYHIEVTPRTEALLTTIRPPAQDLLADSAAAVQAAKAHAATPHFQLVPPHFREMANGALAGISGKAGRAVASAAAATVGGVVGRAMSLGLEGAMGALVL